MNDSIYRASIESRGKDCPLSTMDACFEVVVCGLLCAKVVSMTSSEGFLV